MAGGFFLCHRAPGLLLLHDTGADDALIHNHFAAIDDGSAGQRKGVGDIQRLARGLLKDLVHLHGGEFARDAEAGFNVDERQGDARLRELGDEAKGLTKRALKTG